VTLNIADNKLEDLPLSMGFCIGLSKFGAGINLERNQIRDSEMIKKYQIGPDHMVDFLEKRMLMQGEPKLEEFQLPFAAPAPKKVDDSTPKWGAARAESLGLVAPAVKQTPIVPPISTPAKVPLDDKILVLKKWGLTTIQTEFRAKLNMLQAKSDSSNDQQAIALAQIIKSFKPELDKAKLSIPQFEAPRAKLEGATSKIQQLKAIINASLDEVALTVRGIQGVLEASESSKEIVTMVQLVKSLKAVFDSSTV